jgi:cytochrome oxidase Cu insertion factor (SCO1/SenC/PrrC family)
MIRAVRNIFLALSAVALVGAAPKEWRVTDQNGTQLRFGSEVVLGQVTVVHFMFTTCQSFCPLSGSVLGRTQTKLANTDPALDYRFVSISIKPNGTTPSRLKQWLRQHGARPNWKALHVEQPALGQIMRYYGESETNVQLHSSQMLVLNDKGVITKRFDALPTPDQLHAAIQRADTL